MTQPALLGQFPLTAPDLGCTFPSTGFATDSDPLFSETLSEIQNLQQDLGHRLVELPGSNLDFGPTNTRGVGIMMYLNGNAEKLAGLPARIDAEFIQDARVLDSSTTLTQEADGSYTIASQVTTRAGVFGLAWGWSPLGVVPLPTPPTVIA